jgi:hypothetical protein
VTVDASGNVGEYTSLALDSLGNPVVSYYDVANGDLKVLRCGNPTCTLDNVTSSPDTSGNVGRYSSLALDAAGHPVVSYFDADSTDLKVLHCGNATCTGTNVIKSPDTGDAGQHTSLVLDDSGHPVVSYLETITRDLRVLRCGDPTCAAGNTVTSPDTSGNVGEYTSLALDDAGHPVISYLDASNQTLKVLHCGSTNCGGTSPIASPDNLNAAGLSTSLALDSAGRPVVAYRDAASGALRVLRCGDPTCSGSNTFASPDTAGVPAAFISLVLDSNDTPVVSYFDFAGFDLRVLRCGDPTCSSGNSVVSPDTENLVGAYTSIKLDSGGNPVISYRDISNQSLKVLHCTTPTCS